MWAIRNDQGEWWNNLSGWGDAETRDVFTSDERKHQRLPLGGKWIAVGARAWPIEFI